MNKTDLSGKVALVTGASRGIGREVALMLAQEGMEVALTARTVNDLNQVAKEIRDLGGQALLCPGDLSDINVPCNIISQVVDVFGGLDVLVNNAGVAIANPIEKISIEEWELHMAVNVRAPFLLCREAIPYLKKSHIPTIINIASVVGTKGYINQGAYTASKHALMGFTKVLAREVFEDDIRVHVISPGGVATDMVTKTRPDLDLSSLMPPKEIAKIIRFLLLNRGNAVIDEINVRRFSKEPWQ
jgi:3-oxoacyl-[acyl-carrier protein] reductase